MGYGVIGNDHEYIEAGDVTAPKSHSREERIVTLGLEVRALIVEFKPDAIALETAFWGGWPSAAGALGEVRGILLWLAHEAHIPVTSYAPSAVRQGIGVGGNAGKKTVAVFLKRLLRMNKEPGLDASDALAVALCHSLRAR